MSVQNEIDIGFYLSLKKKLEKMMLHFETSSVPGMVLEIRMGNHGPKEISQKSWACTFIFC